MLLLASASPRRHDLLKKHNVAFRVIPNLLEDEPEFTADTDIKEQLIECAKQKALASSQGHAHWVLTADTVVAYDTTILGKPSSKMEAMSTLRMLSGKTHTVYTGFCLFHPLSQQLLFHVDEAHVHFNTLSESDIDAYITEKKPFDKAGSYGIQELPPYFVSKLEGDIETVIGLRVKSVLQLLKDYAIV